MYKDRLSYYKKIEESRNSKLLVYITGDRQNMETKIGQDVWDFFVWHLDRIGIVKTITLYLYTKGGITSAARSLVNLIRQFCDELEIIVPSKALSAGTLMCLGAKKIIMTKQATLGPIDPSLENPLNPELEGVKGKVLVSVEDIEGFIEHAKKTIGDKADLTQVYIQLANRIHPLVLGNAFRVRGQIRMLARKLLSQQIQDEGQIDKILEFLCSESGSHDYTINRREAKELGLPIENPNDKLYDIIINVYDDISRELVLSAPFNPNIELGDNKQITYKVNRAIIESISGGSHVFVSEGIIRRAQISTPISNQETVQVIGTRDEWVHGHKGENP
jgi:hypothetical protein